MGMKDYLGRLVKGLFRRAPKGGQPDRTVPVANRAPAEIPGPVTKEFAITGDIRTDREKRRARARAGYYVRKSSRLGSMMPRGSKYS